MASVAEKKICAACHKGGDVFMCRGCRQSYCAKHVVEHREQLSKDMDNINSKYDRLQQDLSPENVAQPLLSSIDAWERESIEKIHASADAARVDLQQWIVRTKNELKVPFQKMTDELQSSQKLQNYTETDLKRWIQQLEEFRKKLEKLPMIDFIDDDDVELIHLIKITENREQNESRSTARTFALSEQSIQTFEEPSILRREKFSEVFGAATVSEDGLVATYLGPWIGDSSICGINLYSSGTHHIHFRIVEKFYRPPFFGIISASQTMVERLLESPSTNGWSSFDFPVINGKDERVGRDKIIQSHDEVTLTLDCDRQQLFFKHHRTKRLLHLPIDLRECPFPWKMLVVLRRRGDCLRLRGGTLSLSTIDIMAKFNAKRKT
ncbi:unnamed protein product [Didymodactylos carnosus]|uniref:B box-type domain-containing protein n=1 Tax=Didymodactylos carnosus TaxID=1234261 RepID=A0A8S2EDX6_9BILA|nr:unnamed protein product [Didymodactylos carnosus]CAF3900067.1 unnamed protein product [Didymodactylos carnosus]